MEIINPDSQTPWNDQAAGIIKEAFYQKFHLLLGKDEKYLKALKSFIHYENCLVFKDGEKIEGIAVLSSPSWPSFSIELKALRKIYGFFKAIEVWIALKLFFISGKKAPDTMKVEMIAVAGSSRGKGVGSRLLEQAHDMAREKGYKKMKLEVIDTNPGAKKLYERLGYETVKTVNTG